jgi:hypothetical protein
MQSHKDAEARRKNPDFLASSRHRALAFYSCKEKEIDKWKL